MSLKTWGVECAVRWCVCLAKPESQYCAVHAVRGKDYGPLSREGVASVACEECDGTGDCQDCDGEGNHICEHRNCYDEHDCRTCEGTGKCQDCGEAKASDDADTFDARYIAFAFDAGWVPPVLVAYPWDEA